VLQRIDGHRSATDDVLAAWLAMGVAPPREARVLDLGCGHGTVTLLLSALLPEAEFTLIEAQAVSADLARRNLALNGLERRARVIEGDLREAPTDLLPSAGFDLVTGTPPYMPEGSGRLPRDPQRAAARFELRGGIEEYCRVAARCVAPDGAVSMLMDAAQDGRCRLAFSAAGLPITGTLVVIPKAGLAPRFRGYVGRPAGGPLQARELVIRDPAGDLSEAMWAVRAAVGMAGPGEPR